MLNNAQRNHLRIVMSLIEAKMRTIESRLANSEEHGMMSEVRNDITPAMEQALREKIQVIYAVIDELRTRFALPAETKLASREILMGLSQLWVMLQESDAKALGGYGTVDPAVAPLLDPQIERLAGLMFALEDAALGRVESTARSAGAEQSVR